MLVNTGFAWAAVILGAAGIFSITSGWRMHVDEKQALVAAQQAIDFPVGHASAQQVWHGRAQPADVARAVLLRRGAAPEARARARRCRRRARAATPRRGQSRGVAAVEPAQRGRAGD